MKAADFAPDDPVRYVPSHAHGNVHHADCEDGKVTRVDVEGELVFVAFDAHPQQPQACEPWQLVKAGSIEDEPVERPAADQYLGDGVYVRDADGMIRLSGNAFGRENVVFLESAVYAALRRWAQAHGFER
jgi:hypothetical protein